MPPRNPFLTVIVTGVPGVGKTTVLRHVSRILGEEGVKHDIVNFGDYMLSEGRRRGWVEDRDHIRRLPLRRQLELQEYAAQAMVNDASSKLGSDGVLFIDTHAVIKTVTGYWPGLPRSVVEILKPDSIVVVESPPEVIVSRQERDITRMRRDMGGIEQVRMLLDIARMAAMASAVLVSASVFIVENVEGKPEEAAKRIVELVRLLR